MNIRSTQVKGILWDMDGTIFDTEKMIIDCWEQLCLAYGYLEPRPILLKCIGRNIRESNDILRKSFGEDFPVDSLRKEKNNLVTKKIEESGLPIKEGIVDALDWIAVQGIPNALASSSDHRKIISHLELSGLKKYFSIIVGGDEITRGKPDPEIFLTAARKLGIEPEHCIVFEDSHNGVISASEAGMHVAMIPDLMDVNDEIAPHIDYLLKSGTEIIPLLSRLFSRVYPPHGN